ncbi:MAG: branched-chain amino acid ABC transporter permease, partial [Rhodospirillaceae bacterium]|nr:branched-chain amino acid ABC transporter permease [Rhodospirillaceae bacterium]
AFMAIGTLGFAFFVGTVVNNVPIFEGREGISLPKNHVIGFEVGDIGFYYTALAALGVTTLFVSLLVRSGVGRAFMALRDSEKAAEASGVNRVFYRTLAFSLSAAVTGVAGVLFAHYVNYVSSEVFADIWYSVDFLVATVVGGSAVLLGPFVGGLFVAFLPTFIELFVDQPGDLAFIIKGGALIFVLIVAPAGVVVGLVQLFRWLRGKLGGDTQ